MLDEFIVAIVTSIIPKDAIIINDKAVSLSIAADVFSLALSNKGIKSDTSSTTFTDHTKLAGRDSINCAQIGADMTKTDKYLDKEIKNVYELDNMLAFKPVDYGKVKKIEQK